MGGNGRIERSPAFTAELRGLELSAPHCRQEQGTGVPHSEQAFLPAGFSYPQLEQHIGLFGNFLTAVFLYQAESEGDFGPTYNTPFWGRR
jgi:hypothetical protein